MTAPFWACASLVAYAYAGYPAFLHLAARRFGKAPASPAEPPPRGWPMVSLVIAAYDEEAVLAGRLEDALAIDYPGDRFEVIVGSDGSGDGTAEVARRFAGRGVRVLDFAERRGKAAVLNDAISAASGSILLLSDANTRLDPDAARKLARRFADPGVTAACGRLILTDPASGRNADGLYWRYENALKRSEARLGALLGANGALYAIRKDRWVPLPAGTIIDDLVAPLLAVLGHGGSIVYEPDAVAREETAADVAAEFRRRCRIGAGGFQGLGLLWPLLDPRRGWVAFAFLSHKVLRWLGPFFLLGMLASNVMLAGPGFWGWALAAQGGFYAAAGLAAWGSFRLPGPARLATLFAGMNAALLVGFWWWATGRQGGTWSPTARPSVGWEARR